MSSNDSLERPAPKWSTREKPVDFTRWFSLALEALEEGDLDKAEYNFNQAEDCAPEVGAVPASLGLAEVAEGRRDWPEVERCYRKALALAPEDATIHILLGCAIGRQRRGDEPRQYLLRAIELDNADTDEAYLNLAMWEHQDGNFDLAREYVDKALEITPDYEAALELRRKLDLRE